MGWIVTVGHRDHAIFGRKLLNTQCSALINHLSWNEQTHWKSLQKNSLKLHAASDNDTSWYTGTEGFLQHSPCEESLYYRGPAHQKIILLFLGPPLYTNSNSDQEIKLCMLSFSKKKNSFVLKQQMSNFYCLDLDS